MIRPIVQTVPLRTIVALAVSIALSGPVAAVELPDDATLLWEDATVVASVDGHARLVVSDLVGTIALRPSKDGELRYAARTRDNRREPLSVSLWSDGTTLFLRSTSESAGQEIVVEVAASPDLDIRVEVDDSIVQAGGRQGDLGVRGSGLDIELRNMTGAVDLALAGAALKLDGGASVVVEGSGIEATLSHVDEEVELTVEDSTIAVRESGRLIADVSESSLLVEGVERPVTIDARGSGLAVGRLKQGGRLRLVGSPVTIVESDGDVEIETDESLEFGQLKGALDVLHTGFESSVRGADSSGAVTIEMQVGEIGLTKIGGPVQIQGVELTATLEGLTGELTMVTEASTIDASHLEAQVKIHNTLGDVRVSGSKLPVEIVSSGGTVRAEEIGGSLQVWGDGELIEAEWTRIAVDTRGYLENASGGVVAKLPTSAKCKVQAETSYGRIESSVPGLEPEGDGTSLTGSLSRGQGGEITIKAAGDVMLARGGG